MKRRTKRSGSVVLSCAAALASGAVWAVPPMPYTLDPVEFQGVSIFDCAEFGYSFEALADWTYLEHGRYHYDNDGNLVRIEGFGSNENPHAYNSLDPTKQLETVGITEHFRLKVWFDDGTATWYKESGIYFRSVLPGVGRIVMNAGTAIWESEDGMVWTPKKITPNYYDVDLSEWQAICDVLQ